jgi:hypothetical protein
MDATGIEDKRDQRYKLAANKLRDGRSKKYYSGLVKNSQMRKSQIKLKAEAGTQADSSTHKAGGGT